MFSQQEEEKEPTNEKKATSEVGRKPKKSDIWDTSELKGTKKETSYVKCCETTQVCWTGQA